MKCPICGALNNDDDKYCYLCNSKLDEDPFSEELEEINEISQTNRDITSDILDMENAPKQKKTRLTDKIIIGIIVVIAILTLCSCISGIISYFIKDNEEVISSYISDNGLFQFITEEDESDESDTEEDKSLTGQITKEELQESYTYDMFELEEVGDDSFSLSLPEQFYEYIPDEDDDTERDMDSRQWKFGEDFDIIQIGTVTDCETMEDLANELYESAEAQDGYWSQISIEDDEISGYPALKVSAFDSYEQQWVVIWVFEAPDQDEYVHYFAACVLATDKILLESKDTYFYHKSDEISE